MGSLNYKDTEYDNSIDVSIGGIVKSIKIINPFSG